MAPSAHPSGVRLYVFFLLIAFATTLHAQTIAPVPVPGRNVNLSSGPAELNTMVSPPIIRGDFLLKQQNEGSCAMSSRNPKNILCGANDYRLIDVPGVDPAEVTRDAWTGVFQSANYGDTWESTVLPGHYLDPAPSLLKSYKAMADPVVRSGAAGVTYMTGIAFKGPDNGSIVYVATFLDLNNKENDPTPFKLVRITQVDWGPDGQFLDKPWNVVLPPEGTATCTITLADPAHPGQTMTQTIPDSPVLVGYSIFVGHPTDTFRTKQIVARVTNCGANVERRVKVSESQKINQAMALAASPVNPKKLAAVWRRFAEGMETDALLSSVSNDGGLTWTKPIVTVQLGLVCPLDQNATAMKMRTQTFPTLAAGPNGLFYLAWADRGKDPTGACLASAPARIRLASSPDGVNWSDPIVVEEPGFGAHQVNPSLTVGGNTLHLLWQDMRESESGYFEDRFINELPILRAAKGLEPEATAVPKPVKHNTIEILSKMATLNGNGTLTWGPTARVSQYKKGAYKKNGAYHYGQIQWNIPNLRLFAKGLKVFNGDYVDAAIPPMLPPDTGRPAWAYDTGQRDPFFFSVWTDNRDVRRSPAQSSTDETESTPYTPAGRSGTSLADPTQQCPTCVPGSYEHTGTMNQNLYGARINRGFIAYAPGNNKRIRISTEFGVEFQRAYVVTVRNDSAETKAFRLTIAPEYRTLDGASASFTQFAPAVYQLLVTIPKHSSASRTVFIIPDQDPATPVPTSAKVRVDVSEVIGGLDLPVGASVYINPDPTAPEVEAPEVEAPEVEAKEVYAPEVEAPEVEAPEVEAPEVEAPEVEAPEVEAPEVEAPEVEAASYMSPEVEAPEVEAPEVEAPEVEAPEVEAAAITDIVWPLKNAGNTTAGYVFRPIVTGNLSGYDFQLIVSRIVKAPAAKGCVPAQTTMNRVAVLVDANRLVDPNQTILPEDPDYATAWIDPRHERVLVTLRVRAIQGAGVPPFNPAVHPTSMTITQEAINTERLIAGDTTPPVIVVKAVPTLGFTASPSSATSSRRIAPAVTVLARNQFGEAMPGAAVTLSLGSAPSGATLGGTTSVITGADGVATFNDLVIAGAGEPFTLVASALDAAPVESTPFMVLDACEADGAPLVTRTSNVEGPAINSRPLMARDAKFDNDDTYRDLVVLHGNGTITKARGDGTGHFTPRFQFTAPGMTAPVAVVVDDFNEDGLSDFVVTGASQLSVVLSDPASPVYFTNLAIGAIPLPGGPWGIASGDFNGDGHKDIAVALRGNDQVAVLFGNGNGTFSAPTLLGVGDQPVAIVAADVNGDGHADLIVANMISADINVFTGDGAGGFTAVGAFAAGNLPVSLAVADMDRDGHPDIVVANQGDLVLPLWKGVRVLRGDGTGAFTTGTLIPLPNDPSSVAVNDWNNDTYPDIAVADQHGVELIFSDGYGGFGTPRFNAAGPQPWDVWVADATGDCRNELIITDHAQAADTFDKVVTMIATCGMTTADLAVSVTAPTPVLAGSNENFAVTVTNNGPFATVPTLRGTVTNVGSFDTVIVPAGCTFDGATAIECHLAELAAGASTSVDIVATNVLPTTIWGFFNVSGSALDRINTNDAAGQSVTVTATPLTFVVTNTNDSGTGSLRDAIRRANANAPARDTIAFNIPGAGVHTIAPLSALTAVSDSVIIDGGTQPGYAGAPLIELTGVSAGPTFGLAINGADSFVRGLIVNRFAGEGIVVSAQGVTIAGNYLGTDATGMAAAPNLNGVAISGTGTAMIGGAAPADRNVLSGNTQHGVQFYGTAGRSTIRGNYIGTNAAGTGAVANQGNGITMYGGGNNVVQGNVVSGNAIIGVAAYSASNLVRGNIIGTDPTGAAAVPNMFGVSVCYTATTNVVGGATAAERNVISGNSRDGVLVCASNNSVSGNFIGTNAGGIAAVPNLGAGVNVQSGTGNTIGGAGAGAGNTVAGNSGAGIQVSGSGNLVAGNVVGLNQASNALPNQIGVVLWGSGQTVGGTSAGARNVISGNTMWGVAVVASNDNTILGNYIGTDPSGLAARPNGETGVLVESNSSRNTVGGEGAGAGNVISGNAGSGVRIVHTGSLNNRVLGNFIGVDASGSGSMPNAREGVRLERGASSNIVGSAAGPNVIAYNGWSGISVTADPEWGTGNTFTRNSIFSNGGLGVDLVGDGVTANDALDADTGPNNLQNYPVITSAIASASTMDFRATLTSAPNTAFVIEVYESDSCDASGFGEGQRYLFGYSNVMTDATGNAMVVDALAPLAPVGHYLTTTATDPAGNTSEFSACQVVTAAPATLRVQVLDGTGAVIPGALVTLTNLDTGVIRTALTGATGLAIFPSLPPGRYRASSGSVPPVDVTLAAGDSPTVTLQP